MSVTATGTPTPVGSTFPLYTKQPFSYTFSNGKPYSTSNTYASPSSAVLSLTSGNTFVSSTGFQTTGTTTLNVIAISSNPVATTVSTYAGTGAIGSNNGAKATATFRSPRGIAFDGAGNMYIADVVNCLIRKIDTGGIVSTFAGSNSAGSNDGAALTARFRNPRGVASDSNGVVYVGDTDNNRIRKIESGTVSTLDTSVTEPFDVIVDSNNNLYYPTTTGLIYYYNTSTSNRTLYAGSTMGYADGYRTSAQFSVILGVALDSVGDLYVADNGNSRIRKITTSTGMVTTVAGNGIAISQDGNSTTASFNNPHGIRVDSNGIIYVTDREGNKIRRVTQSGNVTTLAGSGTSGFLDGSGSIARFNKPQGFALLNGTAYIGDADNNRIRALPTEEIDASSSRPAGFSVVASNIFTINVDDRWTISPTIVGSNIQLYKYEPFEYTFTTNVADDTLQYTASSTQLYSYLSNVDSNQVVFSSTTGFLGSYSNLSLVIRDLCGSAIVDTKSYTVNVGVGRFFPPAANTIYTFYRNEPITPQPFVAPFSISTPTVIPTLPPGLQLVRTSDSTFDLSGAPTIQILSSNYKVVGKNAGDPTQIITTDINIRVNPERLLMDLSGSSNAFGLSSGATVPPATVTSRCPPYPLTGNNVYYSWAPALLDGLRFVDSVGNTYLNGYVATDPSSTITLTGTISSNATRSLVASGLNQYTTTLTATRLTPSVLSNSIPFLFTFQESVLFDPFTVTPLYVNALVSASSSSNSFRAQTSFSTTVYPIAAIFSPDLRSDLSLNFVSAESRAYLTGTPTSAMTGTYTIRAQNTNGTTGDIQVSIASSNDSVAFVFPTPSVDVCYSFVQSRNVNTALAGYYTSPIQFKANASSGCNVTMTSGSLTGTGLSLVSVGSNTFTLSGVPSTITSLTPLVVTATSTGTSATALNSNVSYSIVADDYTFEPETLDFIQNVPITPVQFAATTLSGRPIIAYSSTNLPAGLIVSPSGLLTGTVTTSTSGSFTLNASTGFTSDSEVYSYTVTPDSVLLTVPSNVYFLQDGKPVTPIPITGTSYSGRVVSNYQFSNLTQTYGLTIGSTTGLVGGNMSTGYPPDDIYVPSCNFNIVATAGSVLGDLPVTMTATTPPQTRSAVANITDNKIYSAENGLSNWTLRTTAPSNVLAFSSRTELNSNMFLGSYNSNGLVRSSNGLAYTDGSANAVFTSFTSKPGTTTWWACGRELGTSNAVLGKSVDDGETWTLTPRPEFLFRDEGVTVPITAYRYAGGVLKYSSNVMIFGGKTVVRSLDEGSNWTQVTGELDVEISDINISDSNMFVMTGSSIYSSNTPYIYGDSTTIRFSTNNGLTWFDALGDFNYKATSVTYGNGKWIATGVQALGPLDYVPSVRYSEDGENWTAFDLSTNILFNSREPDVFVQPGRMGPVVYDGLKWSIMVSRYADPISQFGNVVEVYTHDVISALDSGWTKQTVTGITGTSNSLPRLIGLSTPMTTTTTSTFNPTLYFTTLGTGPTITSPTTTSYILYQYMTITPITFSATGVGTVYFFIDRTTLPVGLVFNPQTQTLSGKPMRIGTKSIVVYAKDNNGVSALTLSFTTIIPRIIHPQSGASAFTSLLRQYTEVNASQNARDTRVFPTQERALGEFMAPEGADVVTPSNCPC